MYLSLYKERYPKKLITVLKRCSEKLSSVWKFLFCILCCHSEGQRPEESFRAFARNPSSVYMPSARSFSTLGKFLFASFSFRRLSSKLLMICPLGRFSLLLSLFGIFPLSFLRFAHWDVSLCFFLFSASFLQASYDLPIGTFLFASFSFQRERRERNVKKL